MRNTIKRHGRLAWIGYGLLGGKVVRPNILSVCQFLALVLSSCGIPGIVSTDAQLPVVHSVSQAQSLPPVRFPQDEAAHRNLTEWWYYTGHMNAVSPDGKAHHYGFELVFFQALRSDL